VPANPDENKRILGSGGVFRPFKDINGKSSGGALRLYMKNSDSPGLAMTRSFGDRIGELAGLISDPEVFTKSLCTADRIVIVGSDGLFEFLDNVVIVKFVSQ